jgi:hypothetical protein
MRFVSFKFILHLLTQEQKEQCTSLLWLLTCLNVKAKMVLIVFYDYEGIVYKEYVPQGQILTNIYV